MAARACPCILWQWQSKPPCLSRFALPVQLADAQAQYQQLQQQFDELKGDFQYNLQLLAERDAELEQADAAASASAAELAAKATAIAQLQAQLAQAQSGECALSRLLSQQGPGMQPITVDDC